MHFIACMANTMKRGVSTPSSLSRYTSHVSHIYIRARDTTTDRIHTQSSRATRTRSSSSFTRTDLDKIRNLLDPLPTFGCRSTKFPDHHFGSLGGQERRPSEAAILIPLCNLNLDLNLSIHQVGPHVLMEVRNTRMRVHAGEVRYV